MQIYMLLRQNLKQMFSFNHKNKSNSSHDRQWLRTNKIRLFYFFSIETYIIYFNKLK